MMNRVFRCTMLSGGAGLCALMWVKKTQNPKLFFVESDKLWLKTFKNYFSSWSASISNMVPRRYAASCDSTVRYFSSNVSMQPPANPLTLNPDYNTEKEQKKDAEKLKSDEETYEKLLSPPSVLNSNIDLTKCKIILFQYQSCPFCYKVRSCLDLFRIPYHVVEVHPFSKSQLNFSPNYKKVPVAVIQESISANVPFDTTKFELDDVSKEDFLDETDKKVYVITDSREIIHNIFVNKSFANKNIVYNMDKTELSWIQWVDSVISPLVVMNLYRNFEEAKKTFDSILKSSNYGFIEKYTIKYAGSFVMQSVAKSRAKKYTVEDPRNMFYDALNGFVDKLGESDFIGGKEPNEADINLFGMIAATEDFPTGKDILENTRIGSWFSRMKTMMAKE